MTQPFASIPSFVDDVEKIIEAAYIKMGKPIGVKVRGKVKDRTRIIRKRERERIRIVGEFICNYLRTILHGFPRLEELHPFYRELADVLIGVQNLKKALSKVYWGLKLIEKLTSDYTRQTKLIYSVEDAREIKREYFGRVASILRKISDSIKILAEARRKLRKIPDIDVNAPSIVIAAAPNVGKSTFVGKVSTAKPEIAEYPFTTKGLILGHVKVREDLIIQIIDTPGLLDRPLQERNKIEMQAILALKHIADVIIFLVDPTFHSGYTLEYQLRILRDIMRTFPNIPLIVALNKIDVAKKEEIEKASAELVKMGIEKVFAISALKGKGVEDLLKEAIKVAISRRNIRM